MKSINNSQAPSIQIITGGAGFIGSAFVRQQLSQGRPIVVLDKLTYAGKTSNLTGCKETAEENKVFFEVIEGDIADDTFVKDVLNRFRPSAIVNFAAETHVDNSILEPTTFIHSNIVGTFTLLQRSLELFRSLSASEKEAFRYLQISTDEVFGSLKETGKFAETSPYAPNSPYSASKASADFLVRAWFHTYGLPTITTNCSNNYGPRQHREKLIPLAITNALQGKPIPIYGDGKNVRDWIHVEDHCRGVSLALNYGRPGEAYCFGGNAEVSNLELVKEICRTLDHLHPCHSRRKYESYITFVKDRAGHDYRYAIDDRKAVDELGFHRSFTLSAGLEATVKWYLEHSDLRSSERES